MSSPPSQSSAPTANAGLHASASIYTTLVLRFYDFWVLTVSNAFAWRCPTHDTLLSFYQKHVASSASGSSHLEIGVGTGYYPAASVKQLSKQKRITLLDLNPATLAFARRRLERAGYTGQIELAAHDVFEPLPAEMRGTYDSVALFYLFHCLPGTFPDKARRVFATVAPALASGGVVYGATILGSGVEHNWFGTRLMKTYNKKGIFGNSGDSESGLRDALDECFEESEVRVVGMVALFWGRKPKASGPL